MATRTPGRTTIAKAKRGTSGAPQADLSAQDAAVIRAQIGGKELAPSSRVQSVYSSWRDVADQLGDPFEREKIPISKLRQMRRDPMLAFGLSFIKVPHVRARWFVNAVGNNGPNPQIAAHLDENLRRIYASFVMQFLNSLDFGFQAIATRFEFRVPSGTYIDNGTDGSSEPTEKAIWSEGGIQPIAWKTFVPLRPEGVEPVWDTGTGEFMGIEYTPTSTSTGGGSGGASNTSGGAGGSNQEQTYKIDLPHSLWVTNEKEQNFGSVFGYPRTGYAYSYWWSYWFRWAIADRAFERKADPSVLVYHPEGEFVNEDTGETMSYSEYALLMGERMRSGGVIALPSQVYEDSNGRGTIREWEIDFTKDAVNFDPFDKSFEYLDVQKLRSLFIPEQAFLEGKGGTSSRNVAKEMGQSFVESQAVLSKAIAFHINQYLIPQWLAANYPEFVANEGGSAEIVIQGFGDEDTDFMLQMLTLIGQQESGASELMKYIDIQKILDDRGIPIVSFGQQQSREQAIIAQQQAQVGPPGPPGAPGVGISPPAGGTTVAVTPNASGTGFSYTTPREVIYLSDSGTDFIENLPRTVHYEDNAVKGFARLLWRGFRDLYDDEYKTLAAALDKAELPEEGTPRQRVEALLKDWKGSRRWDQIFSQGSSQLALILKRAAVIEANRLRKQGRLNDDDAGGWINGHWPDVVAKAAKSTREEVEHFLMLQVQDGITDPKQLGKMVTDHFSDFPQWKSDRIIRTEVREAYNAGTLLGGQIVGIRQAMAIDGQGPNPIGADPDCRERHGKIFSIGDAFQEREHPNGTLAWRLVPDTLAIAFSDDIEGAEFDEQEEVLTLSNSLPTEVRQQIVAETVEMLTT
jgi:hypothetical protein